TAASLLRTYRGHRRHTDARVRSRLNQLGQCSNTVVTLHDDYCLLSGEFDLELFCRTKKLRGVFGNEIEFALPAAGEPGEGEQIHAFVCESGENPGALTRGIRDHHVEIIDCA